MGPTDILRRRDVDSSAFDDCLGAFLCGDLALSTAFRRELAVVAVDTDCRGRELRRGGDSLGGGAATNAVRRVLLFGVMRPLGAGLRPPGVDCVGVFARVVGVLARLTGAVVRGVLLDDGGGRLNVDGELALELSLVEGALVESLGVLSFRTETGRRDDGDAALSGCTPSGVGRDGSAFRTIGDPLFDAATSLCARTWLLVLWAERTVAPFGCVAAERYQSVGDAGSRSGSDFVRWCSRATWMLDSEVLRGRAPEPSMPNPAVGVSRWSGRISPNNRPGARGEEGGDRVGDLCWRFVMDFDALGVPVADGGFRGLAIRLAKDWELFDSWSSATNFVLCVPRAAVPRLESVVSSRFVEVLKVEYDVDPFPPGDLSLVAVADLLGRNGTPRTGIRGPADDDDDEGCWSNLFVRSLTLGFRFVFDLGAPTGGSIGAEADRWEGRSAARAAGAGGFLGLVPLPFDRTDGLSRARETEVAM